MIEMTAHFEIEQITLGELGSCSSRTVPGRFNTREAAFAAAIDHGQELAGPVREGYRRPTVSVVNDETRGLTVKVGDGDVDGTYHVLYVLEYGKRVARPADAGRGYTVCPL